MKLHWKPMVLALVLAISFTESSFGQSVDPLSGRAIINLPLGSISAMDIGASVSLSHSGGAIRVDEGPGNAGMGWNVSMGGYVSRQVRGLPDDINTGGKVGWRNGSAAMIQSFTPSADDNLAVCTDEVFDYNTLTNLGYLYDPEPDIYFFQAPGISGKFIYGADGQPKLIPYQDLSITFTAGQYVIKTNTGMTYTFGNNDMITCQALKYKNLPINSQQSKYNYYSTPVSYASTWYLSNIQSAATGANAYFTYTPIEQALGFQYITSINGSAGSTTSQIDTLYFIQNTIDSKVLTSANILNFSMAVTWANSLVDKITISEAETGDTKEFDFIYKTISSTNDTKFPKITKPFLTQIKQLSSCNAFPSYLFGYDGIDTVANTTVIPWRTAFGQDFFGYYNGKSYNKNIPRVYFYNSETGARRFRVTKIPGVTPTAVYYGVDTTGTMDVNPTFLSYGTLTGIAYPTGGYTNISYEPNKYFDSSTGQELLGPGLRVYSMSTSGGDMAFAKSNRGSYHSIIKTYEYLDTITNKTSGRIMYPPEFAFTDGTSIIRSQSDIGMGAEVMYGRVKEKVAGQGYRLYFFDLPSVYPDAAATVSKTARASGSNCATVGYLKNGTYAYPYAPLKDSSFSQGFMTKLLEFSETNVPTQDKRMTYITPQANTIVKGLKFEMLNGSFFYSTYDIAVSQSRILSQEIVKQVGDEAPTDVTKVTSSYTYNSKNMITQTTTTNGDGSVINNYVKYAMDYNMTSAPGGSTPAILQAAALYKLNTPAVNRYGEVIESYSTLTPISGPVTTTSGQLNIMKDYGTCVWPYQQLSFPQGFTLVPSSVTANVYTYDSRYITQSTVDYANGLPVNQVGISLIPTGVHYSSLSAIPLASFTNCKAENAAFDGFELTNARGFTPSTGTIVSPGWTGQRALQMINTSVVSTKTAITKPTDNTYRVSFWAKGAQNTTFTVSVNSTPATTITLNYTTPNTWTYLEGFISVSTAPAPFTLQLTSNATITIDELVALPKSARVSSKTMLPFTGPTSQTDDRGNSTVITYDVMGRKSNVQDEMRNVVEFQEYGMQTTSKVSLNPNFTANTTVYQQGTPIVFTAAPSCIPGITYSWTFTDSFGTATTVSTGATNNISQTLTSFGAYTVKLTVSSPGYGSASFMDNICVKASLVMPNIAVSPNLVYHKCSPTNEYQKTFTPQINPSQVAGWTLTYAWSITDANGVWQPYFAMAGATFNPSTGVLTYNSPQYTYQVKLSISAVSVNAAGNTLCGYGGLMDVGSTTIGITFINDGPCQ
ncbi:MAG TPA: hypothetical protein PK059_03000 [Cyclobacteriaceae bacterium]|nr:hypothetical protein [Cyclobacteriaceae bacterium]